MKSRRRSKKFILILLLAALISVASWLAKSDSKTGLQTKPATNNQTSTPTKTAPPLIDLQPTVDEWDRVAPGTASVAIIDLDNHKTVAALNPDRPYFAASIYKLYVAYEGYRQVANGTYQLSDTYLNGYNRGQCLDAMIRDSYSPCGEKMWAELGKDTLTERLKQYGLTNTSMTSLRTTAADAAIILERLSDRRYLNEAHTNLFLDSMKTQDAKYRRGLPSGFSAAVVYNKVGWNEQVEWHDTAIISLPNGRRWVITVFTESVGSANIAKLGKAIEAKLNQ